MTLASMQFSCVVIRHSAVDAAQLFQSCFPGPVLNAGAGRGEHPTQALLDALALHSRGLLEPGRHLAIVGDLGNSRVARSNIALLLEHGLRITLVGPPSLTPPAWREAHFGLAPELAERLSWISRLDPVLSQLDAIMLLRVQRERAAGTGLTTADEYSRLYGLYERRLRLLPDSAVILHPGPVNRGVEIGELAFSDPRCLINYQVECGLALRCALLCWALGREETQEGASA
jgi:aspartate carbamoyltransferase catalytic subunit